MSLIAELKRRSVFKVGAAYLVVAWLVIQAASIAMPAFDAPGWVLRTFILIAMLGFPVALVMAWVFDVAPDGQVKVERNDHSSVAFFGVVGALAALSLAWYYLGQPATREQGVDVRSIAVLPFENMSGDPANDYFSDGISEELLNQLAKMPELRVAARTSSFSFKGEKVEVPAIAQALKVRMVLEGSVRKQGERVRITAQLIDAQEGFHVWSETYDRDLKDIFAIQDEIARAIAKELKVKLVGEATTADGASAAAGESSSAGSTGGTQDIEAYDLYLRGLAQWQLRTPASLAEADRLFQQAVERDPKFARAWGGIAMVATVTPYWAAVDVTAYERKGRAAAARALLLDPHSAEAVAVLGNLDRLHRDRWASALVLLQHAEELNPSFAIVPAWTALQQVLMGQPDAALQSVRRAVELDPRSPVIANIHSNVLNANGRFAEGLKACAEVVRANPDHVGCQGNILTAALQLEDRAEVRRTLLELARIKRTPEARELAVALADALDGKGDRAVVARQLMAMPNQSAFDPASPNAMFEAQLSWVLMHLGEPALAVKRNAGAIDARPDTIVPFLWHPASDPLRCRDDFKALVEKIGYPDLRAETVCR